MIQVKANIEIDNGSGQISYTTLSTPTMGKNNVSEELPPVNRKSKGSSAWIIGYSKVGDADTLEDSVANGGNIDYYISKKLTENGYFRNSDYMPVDIGFALEFDRPIDSITIVFDTKHNIYPRSMQIEGYDYVGNFSSEIFEGNDDPIWTVKLSTSYKEFTRCVFNNLNVADRPVPLIVQGIYSGINIDITIKNLINLSVTQKDRADIEHPSFGVYSNKGSISFIDVDGEVKDYIEDNMLDTNMPVVITMENTETNTSEEIASLLTDEWDYDNNTKVVNVSLVDNLTLLQKDKFYLFDKPKPYNADMGFLNYTGQMLYELLYKKSKEMGFEVIKQTQVGFYDLLIKNIFTPKPMSLWQYWTEFAKLFGLHVYAKSNTIIISEDR